MILYIGIPKRINFTQMSRFGDSCESRFRQNFRKGFDWVGYNSGFTSHMDGHRTALAIDPSFIDKSGKHTPGVGYFWSGCASAARHGLEILDIAVIDADGRDAVYLKAVQTVDTVKAGRPPRYLAGMKSPNSLMAWYLRALAQDRDALRKASDIVAADAFFSKKSFVNGVAGVVVVDCIEPGKKTQAWKVFFSTDTEMSAKDIMDFYRTRFQIEFLLRDGKQHTALTHCQSRQKEALAFHLNMSLTAINVARAFARQDKRELSVANVKTLVHNAMMLHRFSVLSGKMPNRLLNTNDFKELLYYGIAYAA